MEDTRRRRQPILSLQRAFVESRLGEHILVRAFELVIPVYRKVMIEAKPSNFPADGRIANVTRSQGA